MTLRCACGIDVHAHVVPADFPAFDGVTIDKLLYRNAQAFLGLPALDPDQTRSR